MAKARFYRTELTVSETNAKNKNFLGVLISILVLLFISTMIVAAIVVINPEIVNMVERQEPREAFTLEETMLNELGPMGFAYQWTKSPPLPGAQEQLDELLFDDMKNLNLMTLPPATSSRGNNGDSFMAQVTSLVKNTSLLASIDFSAKLSPSHRYLLIATAKKRQFRHSMTARYYLYDNKLDLILMLSTKQSSKNQHEEAFNQANPAHNSFEQLDSAVNYLSGQHQFDSQTHQQTRFQVAEWFSSAGRDSLVLIQDNDMYLVLDVESLGSSQDSAQVKLVKVTHTGKMNEVWNGIPDWLYEEEILTDSPAYGVSPDGSTLAYMSFNDSQVDLMTFSLYGPSEQILPGEQRIRYPKAGRVNPHVSVHLIDGLTKSQFDELELRLPEDLASQQHYIHRIRWLSSNHISMIWLNRNQNEAFVVVCSRQKQWLCEKNIHWASPDGWLDLASDQLYPIDDNYYLAPLPKFEGGDVGSFKHIARVSLNRQNEYTFLTRGRREVTTIEGVDLKHGLVYYIATVEGEPGQRQAYTVQLDAPENEPNCLTCSHYPSECLYNSIKLSPSTSYYIFDCDGPGVPRTELRRSIPHAASASHHLKQLTFLESNNSSLDLVPMTLSNEIKNPNLINLPSWTFETERWFSQLHKNHSNVDASRSDPPLWAIQDNQFLREVLAHRKAMPLTVRTRIPISNTSYEADVLLMIPPQLGSSLTFRGPTTTTTTSTATLSSDRSQNDNNRRQRRAALPARVKSSNEAERELHGHFTLESISNYLSQVSPGQQYPMIVDVYAGPGSQKVDYRFNINFGHYLTSARRTIYCMIDGRGSGFQGTKRLYEMYRKFGTVEIQDQIDIASYLARNLSFIDSSKVAIWGWSYGGYVSAMALAKSNADRVSTLRQQLARYSPVKASTNHSSTDSTNGRPLFLTSTAPLSTGSGKIAASSGGGGGGVFECAASVAPVTNWIYYDTAYTERYMSSPYVNEHYDSHLPGDHKANQPVLRSSTADAAHPQAATNKWFQPNNTSDINSHRIPFADFWTARTNSQAAGLTASKSGTGGGNKRMDPAELNDRYKSASLLEHIGDIDRKRFLLVHGTADDNVHFQQSIMLMKKLIQKNIMFDTRVFPDQDHSIANRESKLHLATTLSNFFTECFES